MCFEKRAQAALQKCTHRFEFLLDLVALLLHERLLVVLDGVVELIALHGDIGESHICLGDELKS